VGPNHGKPVADYKNTLKVRGRDDVKSIKPQILAAVSAAIQAYLADEEAVMQQQQAISLAALGGPPGPPVHLWALSGRQEAMHLRLLMQRRSFR
jgi:hypothetical protein